MIKIKDGEVRPEECICEPCLNISLIWRNMRSGFGYKLLQEMAAKDLIRTNVIIGGKIA